MYKCDFFYSRNDYPQTSQPHVLSCWNVLTDIHYSYTRKDDDRAFYPHKAATFIHCLDGEFEIVTKADKITLRQGDFVGCYLDDIVSYRSKSPILEYFWVDFLYDSFPNSGKIYNYIIGDFERELFVELHQAGNAAKQMPIYINSIYYHYLARVMHFRKILAQTTTREISKKEVCNYIDQKYMTPLKVADVAAFFNVTARRLDQIFFAAGDFTPKQYILQTKINKAKALLKDTSVNISEISDMLSFSSPFHFSKIFKQLSGTTPTAYRAGK